MLLQYRRLHYCNTLTYYIVCTLPVFLCAGWNELLIAAFSHRSVEVRDGIVLATGLTVHRNSAQQAGVGMIFDRVLTELVAKMREMNMDKTELGCLRSIILFNPSQYLYICLNSCLLYLLKKVFGKFQFLILLRHRHWPTHGLDSVAYTNHSAITKHEYSKSCHIRPSYVPRCRPQREINDVKWERENNGERFSMYCNKYKSPLLMKIQYFCITWSDTAFFVTGLSFRYIRFNSWVQYGHLFG